MEIKSVETAVFVQTDKGDYIRVSEDDWYRKSGTSLAQVFNCDDLEKAYQEQAIDLIYEKLK